MWFSHCRLWANITPTLLSYVLYTRKQNTRNPHVRNACQLSPRRLNTIFENDSTFFRARSCVSVKLYSSMMRSMRHPIEKNGCPANTKHLYNIYTTSAQRLRRWSNILQMIYKCFMFTAWVILWEIAWHVSQTGWCQMYNPQCQSDVSSDNGDNLIELDGNISSNLSPHITYYCANWSC